VRGATDPGERLDATKGTTFVTARKVRRPGMILAGNNLAGSVEVYANLPFQGGKGGDRKLRGEGQGRSNLKFRIKEHQVEKKREKGTCRREEKNACADQNRGKP